MSDVAHLRQVRPANPQLPVSWYFDTAIFELEKKLLFDGGPNYVGHELMVPNVGDYQTLAWANDAWVLVRNASGVELLSNVCRHRQSIMLGGRGNAQNIVCPLHRWTYDLKGELLGAPHFPESPCVKLRSKPLTSWNGLLFTGPRDPRRDLAKISTLADWDFSGYVLDSVRIDE
jgi:choline monooxygenase